MKLTPEQLKELETLAGYQFTLDELAIMMSLDRDDLVDAVLSNGPIADAYNRGRLLAEAAVRKVIYEQARQGSTPAQKTMLELIQSSKRDLADKKRRRKKDS